MTFVLSKLQAYLAMAVAALLAVVLLSTGFFLVKEKLSHAKTLNVLHSERAGWADERTKAAEALAAATTKARETEQQMAAEAEKAEHEKQTQIAAVSARAADLRRRLRNAEASAATARLVSRVTATAAAGEVAGERDRPELSGPLGYDVVSEAERADTIRFQLAACTRQYNAAREAMRTLKP